MHFEINLSQTLLTCTFIGIAVITEHFYASGTILSTLQESAYLILTTNLLGGTMNYFHLMDGEAEVPRDSVVLQR